MIEAPEKLEERLRGCFGDKVVECRTAYGEVTLTVASADIIEVAQSLRDRADFRFEMLVDLAGIDYLGWGATEWNTENPSSIGFSRAVEKVTAGRFTFSDAPVLESSGPRFAVVYHLLSISRNQRLRLRVFAANDEFPMLPSVTEIWNSANWYEREAFDLYGIVFDGHPDLRRILTDYGFVGHPFRKDFPLVGHVEMQYDPEQRRVVYQPVSIEPRVLVPRVIRHGHPTATAQKRESSGNA